MTDYEASRGKYIIVFIVANMVSAIVVKLGGLLFYESNYYTLAIQLGEYEQAILTDQILTGSLAAVTWIVVFLMFENVYFQRMLWYVIASYAIGVILSVGSLMQLHDLLRFSNDFLFKSALLGFAISMSVPMFFYNLRKDRYYPPALTIKNQDTPYTHIASERVRLKVNETGDPAYNYISRPKPEPSTSEWARLKVNETGDPAYNYISRPKPLPSAYATPVENHFIEPYMPSSARDGSPDVQVAPKTSEPAEEFAETYWEQLALAEEGDADAQLNLGLMHVNGQGAPIDYSEAVKWYRLAAEQGDADAQTNLGLMHANGQGVPIDYSEAVKCYRLAAEQGNATAQSNLALMYFDGHGVPQDFVLAHMWYNLSAANGDEDGVEGRILVAAQMTPAAIEEAQRRARVCMASNYQDCD
jgi:TPR repeat protein